MGTPAVLDHVTDAQEAPKSNDSIVLLNEDHKKIKRVSRVSRDFENAGENAEGARDSWSTR